MDSMHHGSLNANYEPFQAQIPTFPLDGSDKIAMAASSSAPAPLQVSLIMYCFEHPTSGPVTRSHSSVNSHCGRLAFVCRLRNVVADMLREPLNMVSQLHEPGQHTITTK